MMTRVKRIVRNDDAKARELVALYRGKHAGITNTDVWLIMNADNTRRANAQLLSELKTAQAKAPAYLYYFTWRSPVHLGQMKSYHTLDIPFVFANVDVAASMTGSMQNRYALEHRMSAAWAAFARTGNPNHKDLPQWPAFSAVQLPDDDPERRVQGGERPEQGRAAGAEGGTRRRHGDRRRVANANPNRWSSPSSFVRAFDAAAFAAPSASGRGCTSRWAAPTRWTKATSWWTRSSQSR